MALIIGNLDCELAWAGHGGALPARAARLAAAAATLLRGFASDGDRLWTPLPVDPARLPPLAGAPRVELVSGPLGAQRGPGRMLTWGATAAVPIPSAVSDRAPLDPATSSSGWRTAPWRLGVADPAAARRGNDRRLALALGQRLGIALPGAVVVDSVDALRAHLAGGAADAGGGAWVAKAPFTAAGRDRVRGEHGRLDREPEAHARRLLARFGALVLEPWCARIADLGCCGVAETGAVLVAPPHRLRSDARGGFRGIDVDDRDHAGLGPDDLARLTGAARAAGEALVALGYRGPFGIDAFQWRDHAGAIRLHPLCEINARLTFGWVARAWSELLGTPLTLHMGAIEGQHDATMALLRPGAADDTAAWLEPRPG